MYLCNYDPGIIFCRECDDEVSLSELRDLVEAWTPFLKDLEEFQAQEEDLKLVKEKEKLA